jgi:Arc/MetJ family transcription regulator
LRIRIEIDDELLSQAMAASKVPTAKATIESGLRLLLRQRQQLDALDALKGIGWFGDHDQSEHDHSQPLDTDMK